MASGGAPGRVGPKPAAPLEGGPRPRQRPRREAAWHRRERRDRQRARFLLAAVRAAEKLAGHHAWSRRRASREFPEAEVMRQQSDPRGEEFLGVPPQPQERAVDVKKKERPPPPPKKAEPAKAPDMTEREKLAAELVSKKLRELLQTEPEKGKILGRNLLKLLNMPEAETLELQHNLLGMDLAASPSEEARNAEEAQKALEADEKMSTESASSNLFAGLTVHRSTSQDVLQLKEPPILHESVHDGEHTSEPEILHESAHEVAAPMAVRAEEARKADLETEQLRTAMAQRAGAEERGARAESAEARWTQARTELADAREELAAELADSLADACARTRALAELAAADS